MKTWKFCTKGQFPQLGSKFCGPGKTVGPNDAKRQWQRYNDNSGGKDSDSNWPVYLGPSPKTSVRFASSVLPEVAWLLVFYLDQALTSSLSQSCEKLRDFSRLCEAHLISRTICHSSSAPWHVNQPTDVNQQ